MEGSFRIKEIILGFGAALFSAATFWLWESTVISVIARGDFMRYASFIIPFLALAVSASLFALASMLIRDRRIAYSAAIVGIVLPNFLVPAVGTTLAILAGSIIGIAFAVHKIRREFALSVGFSVSKVAKSGLALYFTVASLLISLFYVHAFQKKDALAVLLPKPAFDYTLNYFLNSQFARSLTGLPLVRQDITADEFLDVMISRQLSEQGLPSVTIPASERARLRAVAREELARQYGITFQGKEKVNDLFYTMVAARADELLGSHRRYLPFISGFAFFFAFKALTLPIYLVALLISFLLIKISLSAKLLKRVEEEIKVERIVF